MSSWKHCVSIALVAAALPFSATAQEHLIRGVVTQWEPMISFIQPGDSIKFVNMIGHDTEAIEGMVPEGAERWKAQLGEEGFSVTLTVEGAYIYTCKPHISLGMVGAVIVGPRMPANMEAIEAALPSITAARNMVNRAIRKMKQAIEQKQAQGA